MTDNNKKTFQKRRFISTSLFFSFFLLAFSGAILYLRPEGSIARWTGWNILGIDKKGWEGIHTIFCIMSLVIVLIHVTFNRKALLRYLIERSGARSGGNRGFRWELAAAAGLVLCVFVLAVLRIPPASKVMEWRDAIKDGALLIEFQVPEPYFEKRSLQEISEFLGISVDYIFKILSTDGIEASGPDDTLENISRQNNLSPQNVFGRIVQALPDP